MEVGDIVNIRNCTGGHCRGEIMKYNIGPPEVFHGDSLYIFFVEISAIITKMYIESTIKESGVVDHMNVVEVPTAQVDQFELICDKYNIQFKAV